MADTDDQGVPVDLVSSGLLWLINRVVFHPRGFALGVDDRGAFRVLGDGTEVWQFEGDEDAKFLAANKTLDGVVYRNTPPPPLDSAPWSDQFNHALALIRADAIGQVADPATFDPYSWAHGYAFAKAREQHG